MFRKVFVAWSCLFVLGGCTYDEPMPQIVYDYNLNSSVPPGLSRPARGLTNIGGNIPRDWLPPSRVEKRWTAIVLHHSGTESGNATIFDKLHREGRHWEGVGYDFVIGNGTDSGDGQVEVTFRWRNQITGAHCGGTHRNWANKEAVGICLVGNFNQTLPTTRQVRSVVKLIRFLQERYGIAKSRVFGHNTTPGARPTDCPGKSFPMAELKSMLDAR